MEKRIKIIFCLLFFGFFFIEAKLFYWQIIKRKDLTALANTQYQARREVFAERGIIRTSDNYPLVLNKDIYLLYANPSELQINKFELKEKIFNITQKEILNIDLLDNKKLYWAVLLNNINEEQKLLIENLKIPGLGFEKKEKRFYPEASMSAQLLGFVGIDQEEKEKGFYGLEGYYEKELRGKSGMIYYEQDALGRKISNGASEEEKTIPGRSVVLNIDRVIQYYSEKYLAEGIKTTGASSGWVLIINPNNGAVLSMASYPSYDPQTYYNFDQEYFRNPIISSVFEPGSIFKVIAMATALESKSIVPEETCTKCSGPRKISDYTINTWNEKYYPGSSMTDIIVHSDNVGMVYVSEKTGLDTFYKYLVNFGFGDLTGIDLQGEIASPLRPKENWYDIDLATASFGQGIAVTPIQIISAIGAIANGGDLYQPQVVKSLIENEKEIKVLPIKKRKVISLQTANLVKEMMIQMVEKNNTNKLKTFNTQVAGKSGTAQVPVRGTYDENKTITSFVGFAPAQNPQFLMLVTLKEPKSSIWAEATAAPVWFNIAKEIVRLWNLE
jgi:cell division protein FtsI/penicillin-binding protein 2